MACCPQVSEPGLYQALDSEAVIAGMQNLSATSADGKNMKASSVGCNAAQGPNAVAKDGTLPVPSF